MKTERRHELQTNDLADTLGRWIKQIQPYTRIITVIAIVAILAVLISSYYGKYSAAQSAEAWEAYYLATAAGRDEDKLEATAKKFSGTAAEEWARLAMADNDLSRGSQLLLTDKSEARKRLNDAMAGYGNLSRGAKSPLVQQRATYNQAVVYEMLGQLDDAVGQYRAVEGPLAELAKERADELESNDELRGFYDWLVDAEPPPPFIPPGGVPGAKPPLDVSDPLGLDDLRGDSPAGEVDLPSFADPPAEPKPGDAEPDAESDGDVPPESTDTPDKAVGEADSGDAATSDKEASDSPDDSVGESEPGDADASDDDTAAEKP